MASARAKRVAGGSVERLDHRRYDAYIAASIRFRGFRRSLLTEEPRFRDTLSPDYPKGKTSLYFRKLPMCAPNCLPHKLFYQPKERIL